MKNQSNKRKRNEDKIDWINEALDVDWDQYSRTSQLKSLKELIQDTSGVDFKSDDDPSLIAISKKFNACMRKITMKNSSATETLLVKDVLQIVSNWYHLI